MYVHNLLQWKKSSNDGCGGRAPNRTTQLGISTLEATSTPRNVCGILLFAPHEEQMVGGPLSLPLERQKQP